ncbi:hypothetical protein RDI58_010474 [Solanum bulbocastanum]|uniref:Uncharacterized protein n=1 Tax=Solanum bulbocastanum TaxID=147425 RepID=A0AAN8TUY5_SOLBU
MEAYCDPMLKTEAYLKSYSERIHPIPDESFWPPMNEILPSIILPPDLRRWPGRPSKNRKRVADEGDVTSQSKRSCTLRRSNCKYYGHYKWTCQGAPVKAKGKKGKGYG